MKVTSNSGRLAGGNRRFLLLWAHFCLLAGGILLAGSAYLWIDAQIYQTAEGGRFDAASVSEVVNARPVPAIEGGKFPRPRAAIGSVLGRLEIPRLGISVVVLEGSTGRIFRRAAGHLEGTATPGEPGNVAIAAHRDTFFRPLRKISGQDFIRLTTNTRSYLYQVRSVEVVEPDDATVLADSSEQALTLITCYPFYFVGPAPKRFIVHAKLISSESLLQASELDNPAR